MQASPSDKQGCGEHWQVTGGGKVGEKIFSKMDTRKDNTVVVFHTSTKVVLQSKPRCEKAFDRRRRCDSHLCQNPTVWILSVVNPTLEEGFDESSIRRFYTVGPLQVCVHWLRRASFRKTNNYTLKWHSHSCKPTQSHHLVCVTKFINLNR